MAVHKEFKFTELDRMFGGVLPALFDEEMRRVLRDCNDRHEDDKARVVKIEFKVAPKAMTHGDEVEVDVEVTSGLPKKRTRIHTLSVKSDGRATFHPDFDDDPNAMGLYDDKPDDNGEIRGK